MRPHSCGLTLAALRCRSPLRQWGKVWNRKCTITAIDRWPTTRALRAFKGNEKKLYTFAVDTFLALAASFGQRDADLRIQHRLLHLSSWANGWSSISGRSYSPNACVRVPERQNSGPICVCKSPEPKLPMRRVQQPEIRSQIPATGLCFDSCRSFANFWALIQSPNASK